MKNKILKILDYTYYIFMFFTVILIPVNTYKIFDHLFYSISPNWGYDHRIIITVIMIFIVIISIGYHEIKGDKNNGI